MLNTSDLKIYATPNLVTPSQPVIIDAKKCIGCNRCVEACPNDVFIPNPEPKQIPIIIFAQECWYCACCVRDCPLVDENVIEVNWPMMQRVRWKRKTTQEHFRIGMSNPPPPNKKPLV